MPVSRRRSLAARRLVRASPLGAALLVAASLLAAPAMAGDLVYQPVNPSFGGDPFNASHLMALAETQNEFPQDSGFGSLLEDDTLASQFYDAISGAMVSGAASELTEAVFDRKRESGTIILDGATATYRTIGDHVEVTVSDGLTVSTLRIPVPVVE